MFTVELSGPGRLPRNNLQYFTRIKYLGGGTYGEVLKAFDHKFDTEVAIKILNNGHSESRTNAEFETIQHINHHFPKSAFFVRNIEGRE